MRAFARYPSFLKARVVRDPKTGRTKGFGFVSFGKSDDYLQALKEMHGLIWAGIKFATFIIIPCLLVLYLCMHF